MRASAGRREISPGGHDAVDMGMVLESLVPGVQHGQEAQAGSEPFGIGGHLQQSLGHGAEQNAVDDPRVLQRQRRQFVREREDHVGIRDRQNLARPVGEPLVARPAVALGAVAVAARFVFDHLMGAVVALLQ